MPASQKVVSVGRVRVLKPKFASEGGGAAAFVELIKFLCDSVSLNVVHPNH